MKFIKFFANVIADQNGDASSKRVITFILVYFLFLIVKGSLAGKPIDQNVLFIVGGLIALNVRIFRKLVHSNSEELQMQFPF